MPSDRIILLGFKTDNTESLLQRLGYQTMRPEPGIPVPEFLAQEIVDGILLDSDYLEREGPKDSSGKSLSLVELTEFFRSYDSTRTVPIVALLSRPRELQDLKEQRFPRMELLLKPVPIGMLASRIATALRVRKLEGADRSRASLGDMNANLRDLNQRLSLEREEAKRIQIALLPSKIPVSDTYDLAVSYRPLEDVGGDWYYFETDAQGGIGLQVADITGHGIAAAFIGSMTKLALTATGTTKPADLLAGMNKLMSPVLPEGRFVTMGSFNYDPVQKLFTAACAGHPPALLLRTSEKKIEEMKCPGFALGFEETASYMEKKVSVSSGDVVIMYTDGLSEALNRANAMFGSSKISEVLLQCKPEDSAQQIMKSLFENFDAFREERLLKDDVTVLVLKIK